MKIIYLVLFMALAGCKKDLDNSTLKGKWVQANQEQGQFEGSTLMCVFKCGNFDLKISSYTDAIVPNDSCSRGFWDEYVTGTYQLSKNHLMLDGYYADSLYQKKTTGCNNTGAYQKDYSFIFQKGTLILDPQNANMHWIIKLYKADNYDC